MAGKRVLLTGITGALGPWIAAELLAARHEVTAIARSQDDYTANQRALAALHQTGRGTAINNLNIIAAPLDELPGIPGTFELIVHCAACTAFDAASAIVSRETNIEGLRSALRLARRERAAMVHVSTAYICGTRSGRVRETETYADQRFHNTYEATKCIGEQMATDWASSARLPLTILRPSIVLGAWQNGRAVRFNTLYHLMAALDHASPGRDRGRVLRLIGDPAVTKNIVPVDYFAGVARQLIEQETTGTFHLTHPCPMTMGELRDIFNALFDLQIEYVTQETFDAARPTTLERLCARIMLPYRPYMSSPEPAFDQSRLQAVLGGALKAPPTLDLPYFQRILTFRRECNWSANPAPDMAAPINDGQKIADYFERFLAARLGLALLPSLKKISSHFQIAIADQPGVSWALTLRNGALTCIGRNGESSDCTYTLSAGTFLRIASAELSPQKAFFQGQVKIAGDMETGLKIATLLGKFFTDHPYSLEASCT